MPAPFETSFHILSTPLISSQAASFRQLDGYEARPALHCWHPGEAQRESPSESGAAARNIEGCARGERAFFADEPAHQRRALLYAAQAAHGNP